MSEEKKDEPKQSQQPKPQPRFEKPEVDFRGEKGKYIIFIWAFDQFGKAMNGIVIKIFYDNEAQPRFRLISNSNDAIEFPIEFSSEKLKVTVMIGHKKEEKELLGPEQPKTEAKIPKELKGHGVKAYLHAFFHGKGGKK